jgi:hypothetical protein
VGGLQRGQLERERLAFHCQEIFDHPTEDRDGYLPGCQHGAAGVRFQDQGQLLRQVVRLLPWRLQQHDCSGEYKNKEDLFLIKSWTKYSVDVFAIHLVLLQMNRQFTVSNVLLGKDTFGVTVFPHVDYVFIAALVVMLDEIHRERSD